MPPTPLSPLWTAEAELDPLTIQVGLTTRFGRPRRGRRRRSVPTPEVDAARWPHQPGAGRRDRSDGRRRALPGAGLSTFEHHRLAAVRVLPHRQHRRQRHAGLPADHRHLWRGQRSARCRSWARRPMARPPSRAVAPDEQRPCASLCRGRAQLHDRVRHQGRRLRGPGSRERPGLAFEAGADIMIN